MDELFSQSAIIQTDNVDHVSNSFITLLKPPEDNIWALNRPPQAQRILAVYYSVPSYYSGTTRTISDQIIKPNVGVKIGMCNFRIFDVA